MIPFLIAAGATFVAGFVIMPLVLTLARLLGLYAIVPERRCFVYVLFGKVIATIDEPGLHLLVARLGWRAFIVNWMGTRHVLDMRLDQEYLRSQPVNSEEGAPMGIGIWYEMFISDPVSYLFKNTDPRGSLAANVSNSTVRCLSNLPLANMLINRHAMSSTVPTRSASSRAPPTGRPPWSSPRRAPSARTSSGPHWIKSPRTRKWPPRCSAYWRRRRSCTPRAG